MPSVDRTRRFQGYKKYKVASLVAPIPHQFVLEENIDDLRSAFVPGVTSRVAPLFRSLFRDDGSH